MRQLKLLRHPLLAVLFSPLYLFLSPSSKTPQYGHFGWKIMKGDFFTRRRLARVGNLTCSPYSQKYEDSTPSFFGTSPSPLLNYAIFWWTNQWSKPLHSALCNTNIRIPPQKKQKNSLERPPSFFANKLTIHFEAEILNSKFEEDSPINL